MANPMDAPEDIIQRSLPSQQKFASPTTNSCGCPKLQKNDSNSTASRSTNKPPLLPKPKNISALNSNCNKIRHQLPLTKKLTEKTDKLELNQIESEVYKTDNTNHGFKTDDDVNSNISQVPVDSIIINNKIDSENNNNSINNKCLSSVSDLISEDIITFDDKLEDMLDDQPDGNSLKDLHENEKLSIPTLRKRIINWFGSFGKGNVIIQTQTDSLSDRFSIEPDTDSDSLSSLEYKHEDTQKFSSQQVPQHQDPETVETKEKSQLLIEELISTEKVFIDVLKLLCKTFVSFVQKSESDIKIIPPEELLKIISPLPQLLSLNKKLLQDMEKRIENWNNNPKISDVIVKIGPFLKLYSTYIQNFESQSNLLDECCQKYPKFQKCVKDFEALEICKKLTIKHYMLKPIQRIPQYRLLLENYLKYQDEKSLDYDDTKLALEIVSDVANHINKTLKKEDCLSKLLQIQSQLGNYVIIKPGREFIKEGELYKLSRKEMQLRNFILLNDCLLYTSFNGTVSGLKVNYELSLNGMKVIANEDHNNEFSNEFSVITKTRSFILRAQSTVECEEWITAIKKAISEYKKRQQSFTNSKLTPNYSEIKQFEIGNEAPVWIQDCRATMCQSCTVPFTVTYRRHHCRACGKVVCRGCSENKAPLNYMKFQSARVCDDCYNYLLNKFEKLLFESQQAYTDSDHNIHKLMKTIKNGFKKSSNPKKHIYVPRRLKEANKSSTQMCGWLHQREKRKLWKKFWFVLKDQVLYWYKASEDVLPLNTMPILGYSIQEFQEGTNYEEYDACCVFQLDHAGQNSMIFYANTRELAKRWIHALNDAQKL